MNHPQRMLFVFQLSGLTGCAHIDFGADGLLYYEPKPYLYIVTAADCSQTAALVSLPGKEKHIKFVSGYGSANLNVKLTDGMISDVGQNADSKIPETITPLAALKAALAAAEKDTTDKIQLRIKGEKPKPVECEREGNLYPVVADGNQIVDTAKPIKFPISVKR